MATKKVNGAADVKSIHVRKRAKISSGFEIIRVLPLSRFSLIEALLVALIASSLDFASFRMMIRIIQYSLSHEVRSVISRHLNFQRRNLRELSFYFSLEFGVCQ